MVQYLVPFLKICLMKKLSGRTRGGGGGHEMAVNFKALTSSSRGALWNLPEQKLLLHSKVLRELSGQ